jgi:hypothetical protein
MHKKAQMLRRKKKCQSRDIEGKGMQRDDCNAQKEQFKKACTHKHIHNFKKERK